MTKTQQQANHLGMTETAFLRRKVELNRQEHKVLLRKLAEVRNDTDAKGCNLVSQGT